MQSFSARPALLLALPLLLASVASHARADEKTIRPGYWSYTTSVPGSDGGRQCVRPDQIDDFMAGPHNKHYKCTYPKKFVGDGHASFDGVCVSKHGKSYKLKVAGSYSPTNFKLSGSVTGVLGLPIPLPISIESTWIGPDCPPDVKPAAK